MSLFFAIRSLKLKVVMVVHIICIIAMILPCQHAEDQVKIFLMRKKVGKFNCRINWRLEGRGAICGPPYVQGGVESYLSVLSFILLHAPVCGRVFLYDYT